MGSFDVTIVAEPQFLRVTTVGEYAFDELIDFLERVKDETVKAGLDKVLIDSRRLEGVMTEAERFQGGKKIAEIFGSRIKVALLKKSENITKLGELTATNRGAKFLVTGSETAALNWLTD